MTDRSSEKNTWVQIQIKRNKAIGEERRSSEKPKEDILEVEGSVSYGIGYLWKVTGTKAENANLSKQSEDAYPTSYRVHVFSEHHGGPQENICGCGCVSYRMGCPFPHNSYPLQIMFTRD